MLQSLIGNIGSLDSQSADQLVELIDRHPYCQAFQMLYAVALANIHSTKLNAQVQRAAIAMPDRLKLCQVVSKGEYEWISLLNEIEERKNSAKSSAANDDFGETSSDSLPYDISSAAIADYEWDDADECETSDSDEQDALIDSFIEAEKKASYLCQKSRMSRKTARRRRILCRSKKYAKKHF